MGELCRRDADCESGLVCDISAIGGPSVCRAPMVLAKQYAEDCTTSSDCDITRYIYYDIINISLRRSSYNYVL